MGREVSLGGHADRLEVRLLLGETWLLTRSDGREGRDGLYPLDEACERTDRTRVGFVIDGVVLFSEWSGQKCSEM